MRFFKYLIFFILSFISVSTYSATEYFMDQTPDFRSSSIQTTCSNYAKWYAQQNNSSSTIHYLLEATLTSYSGYSFVCNIAQDKYGSITNIYSYGKKEDVVRECWFPDYKIVSQPISSLKKTMCLPVNGLICKYTGDPTGSPIINGSITTTFSSVSKTPDPTCKEELVNPPCDPKDPYGGCFTPPDDGCTRQFNGSIECPADTQPPIEKGCNGATYCDRPPQGCGDGYVSGSFNGKQICIKTSPSTGSGDGSGTGGDGSDTGGDGSGTGGDGSGTGSTTGTGTGTSTSTNTTTNSDGSTTTTTNTTVNNFSIDFGPMIKAINDVASKITNLKNELLTSINELGKKLDSTNNKIDSTNTKLDSTNTKLTEINDSSLRQEELLKAIRDKQSPTAGGDGSPSEQPASGASTDLTETNGILNDIKDALTKEPDLSPLKADLPTGELTQQSLKTDIFGSTAQCPADRVLNLPLLTKTYNDTFSYQLLCSNLAIVGFLIMIAAYVLAAYIVSKA